MVVAFDLRPLQSGHQYRGIGIVLHNLIQEILKSPEAVENWEIIYYVYEHQPLPTVIKTQLPTGRIVKVSLPESRPSRFKLIRRLNFLKRTWSKLNSVNKLPDLNNVDVFIQFDFLLGLPKSKHIKKVLVKYDIIPLVMEKHYLPSFSEVKSRTSHTKAALKAQLNRWRYLYSLRTSLKHSDLILAISKHTKKDLEEYLNTPAKKIKILHLAADQAPLIGKLPETSNSHFTSIDWRFIDSQKRLRHLLLYDAPYILYIGGADPRRRIQDLITAFNHIRSTGFSCRLLLVGFDFQTLDKIPNNQVKEAIRNSSFGSDIYLLGFVDSAQKFRLYQKAIAFIYPTVYEGFGLPVLEAMVNRCPVICYKNSSLEEVGGDAALYVNNPDEMVDAIHKLLEHPRYCEELVNKGLVNAAQFSWQKTSTSLIKYINEISSTKLL